MLSDQSVPGRVLEAWYRRRFTLLSSIEQIEELKRVSHYTHLASRLSAAKAGRLVNDLRIVATIVGDLQSLDISSDPFDNYVLAMVDADDADYLVSGDKADLLALGKHGGARIISVREFATVLAL